MTPGSVNRRHFVQASTALGGALVLGLALPACGRRAAVDGEAGGSLNAWLRIGSDDTITIVVDRVEMGQGVYTALPALIAEELEVPLTGVALEAAPVADAYVNQLLGGQITGGSTSMRDAWDRLRLAGARARTMLIAAAANRWGVDPARCRVEQGAVIGPAGQRLRYGALAEAAAKLPVPANAPLKDPAAFAIIGRPVRRLDVPSKVSGAAVYGIDVTRPGLLHATLVQCPFVGGSVKAFDSKAAERMPGVRSVLLTGSGVVVVAEGFWQALRAREALLIEWEPGVQGFLADRDIRAALAQAAGSTGESARADGDATGALRSAARRLRAVYEVPLLAHATLEPMNCTADVRADGCDLYVPHQSPSVARAAAAAASGLPPERISVHMTFIGGGFGRRFEVDFVTPAVEASKAVGAPVKLVWTREDDMTHDAYRPPARTEVVAGLDAEGRLVACQVDVIAPSPTARLLPHVVASTVDPLSVEGLQNLVYDVPNLEVNYIRQEIGLTVGYWRSISYFANCFTVECFIDEIAAAAGADPLEFRRGLLAKQPRALKVMEAAAVKAGWGRQPPGHHLGLAVLAAYGSYLAAVAEILVEQGEVRVHRIVCVADCGRIVTPAIVESQVEGGIVFGLTATLWGRITLADGRVQETNFHQYRLMRLGETPRIDVVLIGSEEPPGGMGEPSTALVAPAVCNAIFAATGTRLRSLPITGQAGLSA